jgi:hypothetical protein
VDGFRESLLLHSNRDAQNLMKAGVSFLEIAAFLIVTKLVTPSAE